VPGDQTLRQDLAGAFGRRREEIIRRWLERVTSDTGVSGVPLTELRDALPSYLAAICAELVRREEPITLEQSGAAAWRAITTEHAITRVRMGFDVSQLVHEFIIFRRVLQEIAEEEAISTGTCGAIVAEIVEAAIAVAVHAYVDARDYAARRAQAEHVGFITHELRNPLSTAKLASARLRRAASPDQGPILEALERAHRRLEELVDSVLASQRLEAGGTPPRPERVVLAELLAEILATGRREAEAMGIRFEVRMDPALALEADPTLTRSAVQNLVENAVKYTDEGWVEVEAEDRGEEIVVHVRDTCHGLSPEELGTIFEPFWRGHSRKPGTGLGLAIARRAIELQGGRLQAESPGQRGCHFWLTLPRKPIVVMPGA
jgi:signal transduction histidine kinase